MTRKTKRLLHATISILPCVVAFILSADSTPDRVATEAMLSSFRWEAHYIQDPYVGKRVKRTTFAENWVDPITSQTFNKSYVHESLSQVESWILALGAAVTVSDLDLDGMSDDLLLADPRFNEITVMKAPFSPHSPGYSAFPLRPKEHVLNLAYNFRGTRHAAGVSPMGSLVSDFNGDGAMDVLVYYWGRSPLIFERSPTASLSDGSDAFTARDILETPEIWHTSAAVQGDFDGDGVLDLIFGNFFADHAPVLRADDVVHAKVDSLRLAHLPAGVLDTDEVRLPKMQASKAKATNGGDLHILRGVPDLMGRASGQFERLPTRGENSILSREIEGQWVLALGAADLDRDGMLDLYVANDFGPDLLLSNGTTQGKEMRFTACYGKRSFTTPKSCVVGRDSFKGMSVCIADLDGDGFLDIQVGNITDQFALQESHFVWLHNGDLNAMKNGKAPFTHASEQFNLARHGWEWDTKVGDFNNDGFAEILQACGFIYGERLPGWASLHSVAVMNPLALNTAGHWAPMKPGIDISGKNLNTFMVARPDGNGHLTFTDLNKNALRHGVPGAPFPEPLVSRGFALADMNNDGWLDFAVANQFRASIVYENQSNRASPEASGRSLTLDVIDQINSNGWEGKGNSSPAYGATVILEPSEEDGVSQTALVDPGNGHAGRSASEVFFGLGSHRGGSFKVRVAWGLKSDGGPREFHADISGQGGRYVVLLTGRDGGQAVVVPISRNQMTAR